MAPSHGVNCQQSTRQKVQRVAVNQSAGDVIGLTVVFFEALGFVPSRNNKKLLYSSITVSIPRRYFQNLPITENEKMKHLDLSLAIALLAAAPFIARALA